MLRVMSHNSTMVVSTVYCEEVDHNVKYGMRGSVIHVSPQMSDEQMDEIINTYTMEDS